MLRRILIFAGIAVVAVVLGLAGFVGLAVQGLPSYDALAKYEPPVTSRVYAGDGSLIAEFAREQRVFVPIAAIPDLLKNAYLSAEDKTFYEHSGINVLGVLRGTLGNALRGRRLEGGSTITQQVAKNMLLTSDRTITRKVKEAFLAKRIEQAFSKNRILELYLNEIYLGQRSYGVAAAALNYFNKPLDELTIAEAAYLAALPKAPGNYQPVKFKRRAIARRNWVIGRMADNGFISQADAEKAKAEDLVTIDRLQGDQYVASAHFVEELRRQIVSLYGDKALYDGGLSIRSTLNTRLQLSAAGSLREALDLYDRRHGWRGPVGKMDIDGDAATVLKRFERIDEPPGASGWFKAVVIDASAKGVRVSALNPDKKLVKGALASADVAWAAAGARADKKRVLKPCSVVYVQPLKGGGFGLRQVPAVEGAIIAMDPHTGRILAMVGGYSFSNSQYNRVTQAKRQPGSSFKPIVYASALDYGLTPATLIEDAPFQIEAGDGSLYSPENYTKEFYGPSTLRMGLEKSRNAMTVRLAYEMGMERIVDYGKKLGVYDDLMPVLSMSLGAGETTLMRMTGAYAMFVNGGKKVSPALIDRIQDRDGKTVYRNDKRACPGCNDVWGGQEAPVVGDAREQVLEPIIAYQITSMLEGVITTGTGSVIKTVGKPLAGKTGTTNDYKDAWFVGFSPDLVVGVWIGFDKPKSLGEGETGGTLAAPVFRDFMNAALKGVPSTPFRIPPGVRLVRIDAKTGLLPGADTTETILEAFKPGTEPVRDVEASPFVFGQGEQIDPRALEGLYPSEEVVAGATPDAPAAPAGTADQGLGGIY